jgi:hypothetical protein
MVCACLASLSLAWRCLVLAVLVLHLQCPRILRVPVRYLIQPQLASTAFLPSPSAVDSTAASQLISCPCSFLSSRLAQSTGLAATTALFLYAISHAQPCMICILYSASALHNTRILVPLARWHNTLWPTGPCWPGPAKSHLSSIVAARDGSALALLNSSYYVTLLA